MINELTFTFAEFHNSGSLVRNITNYICHSGHTRLPKVTGKSLGHTIDWTVTLDPYPYQKVVFKFNNESDKVLFILKYL